MHKLIKLFLFLSCYLASEFAFAVCQQAEATYSPQFCPSFKSVAECHCYPLPPSMCQDMDKLYNRMIAIYRSVENACKSQHDTSIQNCIDDWHCYREGGVDSTGQLCSGTGNKCA